MIAQTQYGLISSLSVAVINTKAVLWAYGSRGRVHNVWGGVAAGCCSRLKPHPTTNMLGKELTVSALRL